MMHLFHSGRSSASVLLGRHDMCFPLPRRMLSGSIHGNVSNASSLATFLPGLRRGVHQQESSCLHQVAPGQVFISREHTPALLPLPGIPHEHRKACAGTTTRSKSSSPSVGRYLALRSLHFRLKPTPTWLLSISFNHLFRREFRIP